MPEAKPAERVVTGRVVAGYKIENGENSVAKKVVQDDLLSETGDVHAKIQQTELHARLLEAQIRLLEAQQRLSDLRKARRKSNEE